MDCSAVVDKCLSITWCRQLLSLAAALQGFDEAHGLPHTVRVMCIAFKLKEMIGAHDINDEEMYAATILHDVGRGVEERLGIHHAIVSASIAELVLPRMGFSSDVVEKVKRAILEHSYSLSGGKYSSVLSCILSDADKLDALGAIGVYRAIYYSGRHERDIDGTLNHYREKLARLDQFLCSDAARKLAVNKAHILREFFDGLAAEHEAYIDGVKRAVTAARKELAATATNSFGDS
ncbi:HD domain-containing protein [Hyperthermus butylicus]|nr:HD domain-containing protein [Hyperthermus butylicus]